MLINAEDSLLMVIDVQERFIPVIYQAEETVKRIELLLKAAQFLHVPVLASEQYPKGLGSTVEPLRSMIPEEKRLPKMEFSCWENEALHNAITASKKSHIIIAGMEAHVCVLQTALKLKQAGFRTYVVQDAISSRNPNNVGHAIQRMQHHNLELVNSEMVVTEWCKTATHPVFKQISNLIK
jgi:nicotinamidase-related amidase